MMSVVLSEAINIRILYHHIVISFSSEIMCGMCLEMEFDIVSGQVTNTMLI